MKKEESLKTQTMTGFELGGGGICSGKINICFTTDENYAPYLATAVTSILKNAAPDDCFNFYIFNNGLSDSTKNKLKKYEESNVIVNFVDTSAVLDRFETLKQTVPHISKASYFKFVIADLLPDIDKIIYLDSDLIITQSLQGLWNTDLENYLLAAVEDVGYTYWSKYNEALKLKFLCMNSGVMLINCKLWREEELSQQLFECAQDHDKVGFGQDQPVFNYVCRDRIKFVDFIWNVQDTFFRDEIEIENRMDIEKCHFAKNNPAIIHYTYVKKPWDYPLMKQADIFWKYYKMSKFADKKKISLYNKTLFEYNLTKKPKQKKFIEDNSLEYFAKNPYYKRQINIRKSADGSHRIIQFFGLKISYRIRKKA